MGSDARPCVGGRVRLADGAWGVCLAAATLVAICANRLECRSTLMEVDPTGGGTAPGFSPLRMQFCVCLAAALEAAANGTATPTSALATLCCPIFLRFLPALGGRGP